MILDYHKEKLNINVKKPKNVTNAKRLITFYNRIYKMYVEEYNKYDDEDYKEYVSQAMFFTETKLKNISNNLEISK